jgi:hypothetical protein
MRNQVNKAMADGMKQTTTIMASHPNFTDGAKEALEKEGHKATDEQIEELKSRKEQLIFQAECSTDKDMTIL